MIQVQVYVKLACVALVFRTISCAGIDKKASDTVQMISAIFRHGDRSPVYPYPNDPHGNYKWPGGRGALSKKGVKQHFNLGKKLRERYQQLLPVDGQYSQDDIHVVSSHVERCLMSAQSLLAGFMPPLENENLLPINWQPIAISSSPGYIDSLLAQGRVCNKYNDMENSFRIDPPADLKKMNEENKDLYQHLTKYSGKNISDCTDIRFLYDTFLIQQSAGLKLPYWAEEVFPKRMLPFALRSNMLLAETTFMKKVKGGPFLTEVLKNMVRKRDNTLIPNRKVFLYSAHDATLVNILNSLNITDQTSQIPDYASMLILELHSNPTLYKNLEVKIFYYPNSEAYFPKEIHIPKCSRPCSLTKFGEIYNHLLITDFDAMCENKPRNIFSSTHFA